MKKPLLSIAALFLIATPTMADIRIVDGDTLEIDGRTHRINGIDAPEAGQKCKTAKRKDWPCGNKATEAIAKLVEGKNIVCEEHSEDRYGRAISTCYAAGVDVGAALVASGMAWAYVRFSTEYVPQQQQAEAAGLGVWQGDAVPAWEFRDSRWRDAVENVPGDAPSGCPIKGNISQHGQIYHAPWSPWYSRTKIDISKGERWFCDELEAVEAGWRAPYWW